MSITSRIINAAIGILMAVACVSMIMSPNDGYVIVIILLDASFLIKGISALIYYFRMARFMVGGREVLYRAIMNIDLSIFIIVLGEAQKPLAMLYLVIALVMTGGLGAFKALQARQNKVGGWLLSFLFNAILVILGLICFFYLDDTDLMQTIYCIALGTYSISSFITAFKRSSVVYQDENCVVSN